MGVPIFPCRGSASSYERAPDLGCRDPTGVLPTFLGPRAPPHLTSARCVPPPEIIHMLTYLTTQRITKKSTKVLHAFYKYVQGL